MIQIAMEMPKTCYDCPLAMMRYVTLFRRGKQISNEFSCVLTHKAITSTKRNRFCPLRELVRCKDCVLFETGVDIGWCNNWEHKTGENGFCHDAKKKVTE